MLVVPLAACATYLDRTDPIAFDHGEAVRANMVQHIIDPWPAHAQNTTLPTDGSRAVTAVKAYRCRPAGKGPGGGGQSSGSSGSGGSGNAITINTGSGSVSGSSQGGGDQPECQ
jgi:hypothetical protein